MKRIQFCALLFVFILLSACASKKTNSPEELAKQQVEQLYNKGKRALDKGNYNFALRYFSALEANYPYGEYTEQAKLDTIFALNKSGQVERAIDAAENFIQLYPTHPNVDYAYYMKGVASFEKKRSRLDKFVSGGKSTVRDPKPYRDSELAFTELIQRYPNSVYAKDAEKRIIYIRNTLAARELEIAKYYFNQGAYVATLNRCKAIIYQYETTPVVEEGLKLMQKTYEKMGLDELANSTYAILIENFPENKNVKAKKKKKGLLHKLNPFKKNN